MLKADEQQYLDAMACDCQNQDSNPGLKPGPSRFYQTLWSSHQCTPTVLPVREGPMDSDSSQHISRLTYACSAWCFFYNSGERDQLAAMVTRLSKKNYLPPDQPTLHKMVATADVRLFNQVVENPAPLIPPSKSHSYNLRKHPHDLQIPSYQTNISDKNFIHRTILELNHT